MQPAAAPAGSAGAAVASPAAAVAAPASGAAVAAAAVPPAVAVEAAAVGAAVMEEALPGAGAPVRGPRNPDAVKWDWVSENGKYHFHFLKRVTAGKGVGWQATCFHPEKQIPNKSRRGEALHCTREHWAADESEEATAKCVRVLQEWCVRCLDAPCRNDHMSHAVFPWASKDHVPMSAEELEGRLNALA